MTHSSLDEWCPDAAAEVHAATTRQAGRVDAVFSDHGLHVLLPRP